MKVQNVFFVTVGAMSLALGILGVFLPILPTTPFVLLAAFCFSKGSPRLHAWILRNRVFGPLIQDWQQHGVIRRPAKWLATICIFLSFGGLTMLPRAPLLVKVLLDLFALCVLGFIWSRPSAKVVR